MRTLDHREIAARIRACRAYAGKTRKQLADEMGTSPSTLERWEKAHAGSLGGRDLVRGEMILWEVAKACGLDPTWAREDWAAPLFYGVADADVRLVAARLGRIEEALGLGDPAKLARIQQIIAGDEPRAAAARPEDVVDEIERQATDRASRRDRPNGSQEGGGSRDTGRSQ